MRHKGMRAAAAVLVLAACGRESDAAVAKGPAEIVLGPEAIEVVSTREVSSGPTLSGTLAAGAAMADSSQRREEPAPA